MKSFRHAALLLSVSVPILLVAPSASAATVIDFDTVTSFASISEYYNGGADGAGAIGPALGVAFGGDAIGLMNDVLGPYYSNAPTPAGTMTPVGTDATMNVAGGFKDIVSFYYSSSGFVPAAVGVWSGLDGTGTLLASFNLVGNAQFGGCTSSPFCRFDQVSSTFFGTGHSLTFGNAANVAIFDNVSISAIPEPASVVLMLLGVTGLLVARRGTGAH